MTNFDAEGFAWVLAHGDDDSEYWREEAEILWWQDAGCPPVQDWKAVDVADRQRWIDAGAPPIEEWNGTPKGATKTPAAPDVPVHLMLAVTKAQAGALLGGKSVDWIERH